MKSGTDHSYTYIFLLAISPITQNLTTQHIMEKDINCLISVNLKHMDFSEYTTQYAEACTFKV